MEADILASDRSPLEDLPLPIAVAIFVLDMITPREAAFAVLYVGVVLMAARSAAARGIALTAAGCACLTLLAYISDRETLANATLTLSPLRRRLFWPSGVVGLRTRCALPKRNGGRSSSTIR